MGTNTTAPASDVPERASASPTCIQCASAGTELIVTMQHGTVDADPWYRCDECGHVFTVGDSD